MPRDIDTYLVYWKQPEEKAVVSDFTQRRPEECIAAMKSHDEVRAVRVEDVRGREAQFALEQNGFQYVQHDMPELQGAMDGKNVESVIIPKTEKLVQQL